MRTFVQKQNQPQKTVSSNLARFHAATPGLHHRADLILNLQRTIGNQPVQRMLQTNAEELKAGLTGTASPRFGQDFSRIPLRPPAGGAIQTKRAINKPGDEHKQVADAPEGIAAMRSNPVSPPAASGLQFDFTRILLTAPTIQRKPTVSSSGVEWPLVGSEPRTGSHEGPLPRPSDPSPSFVGRSFEGALRWTGWPSAARGWLQARLDVGASDDPLEREADEMADEALQVSTDAVDGVPLPEITATASGPANPAPETLAAEREEEEPIRASGHQADAHPMSDGLEAQIASLPGKGALLPDSVRGDMERGFGFDFSRVRIHAEPAASETAQTLGAHAYTYRNSIVFAPGRYSPETSAGKRLLAHELAHVVQQARAPLSQTAQLQRGRRHLSLAEAESRASNAATNMAAFLGQNILFDFWGGDLRDNDKNGVVDGFRPDTSRGLDQRETGSQDGDHLSGTFPGFRTWGGLTFRGGEGGTVTTVDFNTSTTVQYRVCADLVSAAYRAASIPVPQTRRVHDLVTWFQTSRQARFWPIATFPGPFRPGDFICSYSPRERHGHAGMIVAAGATPDTVHLPGQSQHIARGVYDPTRLNDVTHETWPFNRTIFGIGRFVG